MRRWKRPVGVPPQPTPAEEKHRELLEEQARSGLSLRAFAARRGVSAGHLSWWRYELKRRDEFRGRVPAEPVLFPVRVTASLPVEANEADELILRFGAYVLRFSSSVDATRIAALVRALEAGAC